MCLKSVPCLVLVSLVNASYPYHGQESVQQVNSQDKGLRAVTEEAGQTPQVLHFGISALGRDPTVILENRDILYRLMKGENNLFQPLNVENAEKISLFTDSTVDFLC